MGMFDYILIEQPIDIDLDPDFRPQTKSFDNTMAVFVIRNNTLYRRDFEYEDTDEVQVVIGDLTIYKQRLVNTTDIPIDYHGDIKIAAKSPDGGEGNLRLLARFTEGVLQWVKVDEQEMIRREKLRQDFLENHEDD